MKLKSTLTAASVAISLSVSSLAFSQDNTQKRVWGGGAVDSSTYSGVYVPHVIQKMAENRLAGYQWAGLSQGTVMNAEMVTKHPTNIAVGQLDILRSLNGKPMPDGGSYAFTILHDNIGPECLYAVTGAIGYSNWGHILGNAWDLTVYTGGEKSGSYGTLQSLQEIYPGLQDVIVDHAGGTKDIIEKVKANPASFGFFVMRPDPNSAVFEAIQDAGLTFVPVVDLDLEGSYEFLELKVAKSGFWGLGEGEYVTTACTSVALITGDPAQVDQSDSRTLRRLQATIQRLGSVSSEAFQPTIADFSDMFNALRKATTASVKDLADKAKASYEEALKNVQG